MTGTGESNGFIKSCRASNISCRCIAPRCREGGGGRLGRRSLPLGPDRSPESGFHSPRGIGQALDRTSKLCVAKMDPGNTSWTRHTQATASLHLDNTKASTGSAANRVPVVLVVFPAPRGRNIPYSAAALLHCRRHLYGCVPRILCTGSSTVDGGGVARGGQAKTIRENASQETRREAVCISQTAPDGVEVVSTFQDQPCLTETMPVAPTPTIYVLHGYMEPIFSKNMSVVYYTTRGNSGAFFQI